MKDFDLPLRRAYFTALDGNITINGEQVPVADAKLEHKITEKPVSIIISNQNTQDRPVKCDSWMVNAEISLDIVHRLKNHGSKRVVDEVSDQILTVLFPTKRTTSLTMEAGFRLRLPRLVSSNTTGLIQTEAGNFIMVKTLVFTNILIQ